MRSVPLRIDTGRRTLSGMSRECAVEPPAELLLQAGEWNRARAKFLDRITRCPVGSDYEGLAQALWWLDDGTACLDARERAYRLYRQAGDDTGAARAATALAYDSLLFGEGEVVARGWWGRAEDLLRGIPERTEHGWLAVREAELALSLKGDPAVARDAGDRAFDIGRRAHDLDLTYVGMALSGLAHTAEGHPALGMPRLDSAVTAATVGEVSDLMWMGKIYCWLIAACQQTNDLTRADEWCRRVEAVCERQHLDPLFTVCRVRHSSVLIERGTWPKAEDDLALALHRSASSRRHTRVDAVAQLGELRRRQGRFTDAEVLLRQAEFDPSAIVSRALIHLAQGKGDEAWTAMRELLVKTPVSSRLMRGRLLLPAVLAAIAVGEEDAARAAASELQDTAVVVGNTTLSGRAAAAAASLAAPPDAVPIWRDAVRCFYEARLPFDEAETRLKLARALLESGDPAGAQEQVTTAMSTLHDLGAGALVEQAEHLQGRIASHPNGSLLTVREVEVLRLVADGRTNQQIAELLVLSPHTVHRHVAHILTKLGQPTRAAAAAFAVAQGLL